MKKIVLIRAVSFILLLAVMVAIFLFSAETSAESSKTSGKVIVTVAKVIKPDFEELQPAEKEQFIGSLQSVTRTLAHFLIFAALGFFAINSLLTFKLNNKKNFLIAIAFSVVYALSDELHQHFVPGRAFQLIDLTVDTFGSAFGILAWLILFFIAKKIYKKRKLKRL